MAVYFKFKSAKDFDSVPIDGHFISVGHLKEKIFVSKHMGRGTDFDLMVSNTQTNEEYADEAMLIPKHASVLVRRIPGRPRKPIVTEPNEPEMKENNQFEETEMIKNNLPVAESSIVRVSEEAEWDEFGNDLYAIPDMLPQQSSSQLQEALPPPSRADEDSKIKALIDTSALDWQSQTQEFGSGRGFGRGLGGRMMTCRGFGRGAGPDKKTPPQSYICYRCKVPGHFIQHCPTNGDPTYDLRKVKPPTGIPKSMLVATLEGSYTLPSGAVAVLKPNEAAFEKEIEGIPSTKPFGVLPPELHCPLCKEVMKDAVLTSKCCFKSFCDKCIRDYIISRFMCVCGATNILADDLLPNKTLRETICRILESTTSSGENGGSLQVQDMVSARFALPEVSSPTLSATAKEDQILPPQSEGGSMKEAVSEGKAAVSAPQLSVERSKATKQPDASEATLGSPSVKEQASRESAPMAKEEVQQKLPAGEPGKKKKKKKVRAPNDMQWRMPQDLATESFGIPICPSIYNPYWGGMQCGMDGYMAPYGNTISYMGFAPDPFALPFGAGMSPQYPFGGQGYIMPGVPPPRDFSMGSRPVPPVMSREEFEARKADLRRKREREIDKHGEGESRDKDLAKDVSSSADVSSRKSKSKPSSHASRRRHDTDPTVSGKPTRPRLLERKVMMIGRGTPRLPLLYPQLLSATTASSGPACSHASAFRVQRVQKVQPASGLANGSHRGKEVVNSSSGGHRASSNGQQQHHQKDDWKAAPCSTMITGGSRKSSLCDQTSSDEECHFKRRRPWRHESVKYEEEPAHRRGSREREHGSKHR